MAQLSDDEKNAITKEVIIAIDKYTDEDVSIEMTYADTKNIRLTKDLGIGPIMIAQLAVPLTKISTQHKGRGVGVFDAQGANTVQDCIVLVITSI